MGGLACAKNKNVYGTYKIGRFKKSQKIIRLFILTLNSSKLLKTKYRAIAFNVKKIRIVYYYLEKINQTELSFLLLITVCWKSTNQNPALFKSELFIILKILNHYLKKFYQKTFEFPQVTLEEKRKNSN